ncbi:MAG: GGDEF domain-containing protein [Clostridium sp.]|nr:GGDEF domain-containing protein [Clostridium sp.]MCM1398730.1 GGDEF domain-containing protein [Clostridium sp.]MCM1458638.1 GGDEF domain-containing protein [Bacteroides sp.]
MAKFDLSNFIKSKHLYHRLIYIFMVLFAVLYRVTKEYTNTVFTVVFCIIVFGFSIAEEVLRKRDDEKSKKIFLAMRWVQIYAFATIEIFVPKNIMLFTVITFFSTILCVQGILQYADYDTYILSFRKIFSIFPYIIVALFLSRSMHDTEMLFYIMFKLVAILSGFFVVDMYTEQHKRYKAKNNKLMVENSHFEDVNAQLMEYQDKIKVVNEQINFQKIELTRSYQDLEEANIEIESQTEVMKYMASTFDVLKCMNVIVDSIMEVKKPRLCVIYVDKGVYMNEEPSCIVKSNYTEMQQRLKKDIDGIYNNVKNGVYEKNIFYDADIKMFSFVGDTNLNTLAVLPMINDNEIYGMMIIGSNQSDFFQKGLSYYETCIVQFNVAIKSALLYLKTEDIARKDGLTGIYNRVYFKELFEQAKEEVEKSNQHLSVALFDIDKFKLVNDTYGHLAGDNVIKMVASVDKKYAKKHGGFACRYGGEEFLLVLPGKDEKEAMDILEVMHEEIKSTVVSFDGNDISVNVCIGLSVYPTICKDANLLVSRADKAMYYGKKNGRGRLVVDNDELDQLLD